MKSKAFLQVLIFIFSISFFCIRTSADTFVSGNVSGVWNTTGSPYVVVGNTTVLAGQSLTIQPGVSVLYQGNFKITVYGLLTAVGTETDSILFSRYDLNPANRGNGILLYNADNNSQVSYCIVEYMFSNTSADEWGSLMSDGCSPTFSHNTVRHNEHTTFSTLRTGSGIYCEDSNSLVEYNEVYDNLGCYGAGIALDHHQGICQYNYVHNNDAYNNGGGGMQLTYCYQGCQVKDNIIVYNHGSYNGGGIFLLYGSTASVHHNVIAFNTSGFQGAGIALSSSSPTIFNNTIYGNSGSTYHGIYNYSGSANAVIYNNIFWDVDNNEIDPDFSNVTYCDVQGGYPGWGNINADPLLVNPDSLNFNLSANSPCINAGNPTILDPDGTPSDIGAFFYMVNPTGVVTITLTPENPPVVIPATGGIVEFNVLIQNDTSGFAIFDGWIMLTLPNGLIYGPTILRQNLIRPPNAQIVRDLSLTIPMFAMSGEYTMTGYVGAYPDSATDSSSFNFTKSATDGRMIRTSESWSISGWDETVYFEAPLASPNACQLKLSASPNPFNSTLAIRFELPDASEVDLRIYDITGREVWKLASGNSHLASNEVIWDAEGLPSGIYFARLQAGDLVQTEKLLLVK
jgi:hypothetical protein